MSFETIVLFLVGFYILIKGANILIEGAVSVAKKFDISDWVVGVLIVGIGTSMPEFSIAIASAFNGVDIGMATILGSNTFNTLVIGGVIAMISPIVVRKSWVAMDFVINFLVILISGLLVFTSFFDDSSFAGISRPEGFLLLILFFVWIAMMVSRRHGKEQEEQAVDYKIFALSTSLLMVVGGVLGVFVGGRWVVSGAESLALFFGASDALIGLTLVAIGTSLPELTVSVTAVIKGQNRIGLGNIIGSNIFDFLGILGIASVLHPMEIPTLFARDFAMTFLATFILFISLYIGERYKIKRWQGFLFVLIYLAYLVLIIS